MKPPNRKPKKSDASSKLVLEEIIGLTTKNANGLASNASSPLCAYVAGCVVVLYDVASGAQSHLMLSHRTPKPLLCAAMSRDGRFIAAGESGNQPAVLVWDCATKALVSELKGHLYGVECVAFSPDGKHLVSVGGYIYLWDWRSGVLVTKIKASSSSSAVTSVCFSSDARFIVTAGKKHLKFWTVGASVKTRLNNGEGSLSIKGKPVNLGPQKGSSFVSVASATWANSSSVNSRIVVNMFPIYALTSGGVICVVDSELSVTNSVDLKVERGIALSVSNKLIACACCNGIVKIFTSETLNYAGSLLYSSEEESLRGQNKSISHAGNIDNDFQPASALPDAVACQFSTSQKLVVIYEDHTLSVWDINDTHKATRCCVFVAHSACIWDVKNLCCENMHDPTMACVARGCSGGLSFATCSADGTIRLWDFAPQSIFSENASGHHSLDSVLMGPQLVSAGTFEPETVEVGVRSQGFRSMVVSLDGKYLAAGDCNGNLHIYNLHNSEYTCFQDVHDGEILSMSFSLPSKKYGTSEAMDDNYFLVSGGRDRIINLYDVKRNFDIIGSIDDHSAAVTSVKLTYDGCRIVSCSADRSLVFRDVSVAESGHKILRRHHQIASHGTVYDMAVNPTMEVVVTVGQDKKINMFDIDSGKLTGSFKQDKDFGEPIKVTMDPSGSYLVCSYSSKCICMYDSMSGELVTQATGHGEVVTGVLFLTDCKHVVSVGGDGCIFLWKLPACVSSRILQRMKEKSVPLSPKNLRPPTAFSRFMLSEEEDLQRGFNVGDACSHENSNQVGEKLLYQGGGPQKTPTFRFSISRLPKWAQAKVANSDIVPISSNFTSSQPEQQELQIFSAVVGDGGECGPSCPEVQTPPSHTTGCNESCVSSLSSSSAHGNNYQGSLMYQETHRCFAMDKRWLNVYTVCLDLLNSPDFQHLTDMKSSFSPQTLLKDPSKIPSHAGCSFRQAELFTDEGYEATSIKHACCRCHGAVEKFDDGIRNTSICHNAVAGCVAEHLPLHKSGSQGQGALEVDVCCTKSEDSDLFKKHFGSLSTTSKMRKSKLSMTRHMSRYVVRKDYLGGCKRLFDTPIQDLGAKTFITSEKPAIQNLDEKERNFFGQNPKNSAWHLLISSDAAPQQGESNQTTSNPERSNLQQSISVCREALLDLDSASKKVLTVFSELGTLVSGEESSNGPGRTLYDEAGKLLPSIAERVNAVAKLLQRGHGSPSQRRVEVSELEPLLGTLAEALSQRVVDILKNNVSKD